MVVCWSSSTPVDPSGIEFLGPACTLACQALRGSPCRRILAACDWAIMRSLDGRLKEELTSVVENCRAFAPDIVEAIFFGPTGPWVPSRESDLPTIDLSHGQGCRTCKLGLLGQAVILNPMEVHAGLACQAWCSACATKECGERGIATPWRYSRRSA